MKRKQTVTDVLNECSSTLTNIVEGLERKKLSISEAKTMLKDVKASKKLLIDSIHPLELSKLNAMIKIVAAMILIKESESIEVVKRVGESINEYNNTRYSTKASPAEAYSKGILRRYAKV